MSLLEKCLKVGKLVRVSFSQSFQGPTNVLFFSILLDLVRGPASSPIFLLGLWNCPFSLQLSLALPLYGPEHVALPAILAMLPLPGPSRTSDWCSASHYLHWHLYQSQKHT